MKWDDVGWGGMGWAPFWKARDALKLVPPHFEGGLAASTLSNDSCFQARRTYANQEENGAQE